MININPSCNEKLLESCRPLKEYMIYVDKVRRYEGEGSLEAAVERAIEECIEEGVMEDFLRKNRAEVRSVSIFEYDEERHIQMEREEARADGLEEGIKEGIEKGICALIEFGETFDLPTEEILKGIQEKFSLTPEEAQDALKKYGKCMNYQA